MLPECCADLSDHTCEFGFSSQLRTSRVFEWDLNFSRNRSRPGLHYDHALAHEDCLEDVVSHEQARPLVTFPKAEELFIQPLSCELIERAKGLIHQQQVGPRHKSPSQ